MSTERTTPTTAPPPEHDAHPLHWVECMAEYPVVCLWRDGEWHTPSGNTYGGEAAAERFWRYLGPAHPPPTIAPAERAAWWNGFRAGLGWGGVFTALAVIIGRRTAARAPR